MGQTRSVPLKEDFSVESRHFFAVLLDVTQEKITQSRLERPFEGLCFLMRTKLKGYALSLYLCFYFLLKDKAAHQQDVDRYTEDEYDSQS